MTTIVLDYKRNQIACDSRMSRTNGIYNDCFIKMIEKDGSLFVLTGSTCDMDYFIENYAKYGKVELKDIEIDCYGILIRNGSAYNVWIHDGVFNEDLIICNEFAGSGGKFALAALDFGKTAKEAVEYAATKDCFTGGKVHVYDIEKGVFI